MCMARIFYLFRSFSFLRRSIIKLFHKTLNQSIFYHLADKVEKENEWIASFPQTFFFFPFALQNHEKWLEIDIGIAKYLGISIVEYLGWTCVLSNLLCSVAFFCLSVG